MPMTTDQRAVWVSRAVHRDYRVLMDVRCPELPDNVRITTALLALRELLRLQGLDAARFGSVDWNPLAELVPRGAKVVIKPNWVHHRNHSGLGLECLVTHPTVIAALCAYLFKAEPGQVVLCDAPIQGCDLQSLWQQIGLQNWLAPWWDRLKIRDLRLVHLPGASAAGSKVANATRDLTDYVRFDLGKDSLLEPLSPDADKFRVTVYDPDSLARTHQPGRHQYLVARELIEADVVFNLPKLKTHKKAGITGALKNLVGINGHKEFLPHHRKGGGDEGGDCYPGRSRAKHLAEDLLDVVNRSDSRVVKKGLLAAVDALSRVDGEDAARIGLEGSWYGNDTIWRTSLDLQRLLHYGRLDATMSDTPQRVVWNLTDAIVAGEGDGPMAPLPKSLGLLTWSASSAAAEWVNALAMHLDPQKLPIVRESFGAFRFPLTDFSPQKIEIRAAKGPMSLEEFPRLLGEAFIPAFGWLNHCELAGLPHPSFPAGSRPHPVPEPEG